MTRNTIQKALTLEAVRSLGCHPTADQVYAAIAAEHPTISRATVYRNLNQLSESGQLLEIQVPGGAAHYDHNCHRHFHVRCLRCRKVFDVEVEALPDLEQLVTDTAGFAISGYDLVFRGLCAQCAADQSPR